jgi:hypothetical protein
MGKYGAGMRDCCDSPAQAGQAHIRGCNKAMTDPLKLADELEAGAAAIDNDATPSQVGPDADDLRQAAQLIRWAVATAQSISDDSGDRGARGYKTEADAAYNRAGREMLDTIRAAANALKPTKAEQEGG